MFEFVKVMFVGLLSVCAIGGFGAIWASSYKEPIKFISLNNWPCKARQTNVNTNSDKTLFYPFTVNVNKCVGSCITVDDP